MTVRYTETAIVEIEEICSYIANDNERAAGDIAAAIERTVAAIAKRPQSAPIVHDGRVRAKLVEKYQYRVFYEVAGSDIIIRNVRSTRRLRPWEVTGQ
jgi:plasmid stabilization system protein ParE